VSNLSNSAFVFLV